MKKDKLIIGLFTDSFFPMTDGVGMVVDNYAKRLLKYGEVYVFAPLYNEEFNDNLLPYKVIRCKSIKVPFIDYSLPIPKVDLSFHHLVNTYKLDIVHIHSPFTIGMEGISYAKHHHVPVIGTMHSQYKQDFQRAVKNDLLASRLTDVLINVYNKCDECWAVNSEVARIFYEEYGYKTLPKVMNNATEMKPLKDVSYAINYINNEYKLTNEKVFIFVGRINNLKNVFFIVDALNELEKINKDLKYKMFFIGTGQDENELIKRIKNYKLDDKITMCGKITDRELLAYFYARSDLFLFPSLYDASSIVQIEAASQKTPTLFIKKSATSATVTDNVNGFIEENDVVKYAQRINDIITNEKLLKEVSENAYRDLYRNWDDTINEVYDNYLKLVKKKIR